MTTKLIQELVGMCVEKTKDSELHLYVEHKIKAGELASVKVDAFESGEFVLSLTVENHTVQLQAAIDKVKAL